MTIEEIRELGFEELEKRSLEIAEETATADSEMLETLNAELDAIEERRNALNIEIEERKAAAEKVAEGKGKEIETRKEEIMTNLEVRNTPEYIDAFARYIKTGKDAECRALLTENVSGMVPVPEIVEGTVRAAWENDEIFSRVRKTFIKGNLKVGFEASGSPAEIHTEGGDPVTEEELILGIVEMIPATMKKWISVSTEVAAMGSEEFLRYIYDEITYKIIQGTANDIVGTIIQSHADYTDNDYTQVAVPQVEGEATTASIIEAEGLLGGQARDLVVICNRATAAAIKAQALAANFAYDPFDGATVLYTEALDSYADANEDDVFMIVGDLAGVQVNLPEGESVKFVYDEFTLAPSDLIRIIGRLYAAIGVTGPGMFVNVVKGGESA